MSKASERGKAFEERIAKLVRKKLKVGIVRDKRSGAGLNKSDLSDWYGELPLHVEIKDQETIKVKEWFRQAAKGASIQRPPAMFFAMNDEDLACLRVSDLLDFIAEVNQLRAQVTDLQRPMSQSDSVTPNANDNSAVCRNGHILSGGKCLMKGCQFSYGYKPKKVKQ